MSKKEFLKILAIILIIFFIGFFLRVETVGLPGISDDQKAFYLDQNGLPYMYELDSYYNYRLTENFIEHDYLGDNFIDGKNWDLHSHYPPGRSADYPPLIVYVATLFYYLLNIFTTVPLIVSCFWLPAVIGPLSGVVAYLFVRRFSNDYGAFAAGIFIITAPYYFIRTVPGWFDTDMFTVLFPLLIIWFITEGVYTKNTKKLVIFSILASFSAFIFSYTWQGWSYIFYIIILSFFVYFILAKLFNFEIKNVLKVFSLFTGITLFLVIVADPSNINFLIFPFSFIQSSTSSWPNILLAVGELGYVSFEKVFSSLGFISFAGIISLLWIFRVLINKKLKETYLKRMTWFFYILLILWILIGLLALIKGSRFIMILLPPLAISSGIMVGICIDYLDLLKKNKRIKIFQNEKFIQVISVGVILLVSLPGIMNTHNTTSYFTPGGDDGLWAASEWIKNNTSNDTVVISEWSYGYLISAVSNRPVSVDGGSQNFPRTYWIYRAFSTDDENLSQGIFRMIATSGDSGPLTLDNYTKNTTKTVEILNKVLSIDKENALQILTKDYSLTLEESLTILNYTHPSHPRPYVVVTTNSMINMGYWIYYFGLWDFNKMEGYNLTYATEKNNVTNNILKRSDNLSMDLNSLNVNWNGKAPYFISLNKNGNIERKYIARSSNFSFFFIDDYNKSVIMNKGLENSLFIKLVVEKNNSTNFKSIYENKNVIIWKYNSS